jgi:hypothetical protein
MHDYYFMPPYLGRMPYSHHLANVVYESSQLEPIVIRVNFADSLGGLESVYRIGDVNLK